MPYRPSNTTAYSLVVANWSRLWDAIDNAAEDVLQSDAFLSLERVLVREVLKRDGLCASEPIIYHQLKNWAECQLKKRYSWCKV